MPNTPSLTASGQEWVIEWLRLMVLHSKAFKKRTSTMRMHVLCFKWGTKHGPDYVNRLYTMVSRDLSLPFSLYRFTDDTAGIRSEVECYPLPELGCPVPVNVPGMRWETAVWHVAKILCLLAEHWRGSRMDLRLD